MKQIHVLDQVTDNAGQRTINVVFWFTISTTTSRIPRPGMVSRAPAANITAQDQTDLESGAILEEFAGITFPSSYNTTQMKAIINARYTDRATAIAALPSARAFYGVFYDSSTGWSA